MSDTEMTGVTNSVSSLTVNGDVPFKSSFLILPIELRQKIYRECLTNEHPITWPSVNLSARGLTLELLRTCKQIHSEAAHILYEQNTILFHHPSDCNMFQFVFNSNQSKSTKQLLLHIKDRDVISLWQQYLTSTSSFRSLTADFPKLQKLFIVVRSSIQLGAAAQNLYDSYKRWMDSRNLKVLLESIKGKASKIQVKVMFVRFASRDTEMNLLESIPDDFNLYPSDTTGPRLRTHWAIVHGTEVALDASVDNNPWLTGHLF